MMVGTLEGRFLEMLVFARRPHRVLEIGTFSGYSSLAMAAGLPPGGRITTCELSPVHAEAARRHIAASPYADRIEVIEGPAIDTVHSPRRPLRLRLHRRRQDRATWPTTRPSSPSWRPGGIIAADNTLWSGNVVERRATSPPTRVAIRAFNDAVAADGRVVCVQLTVRDGVTLIRRADDTGAGRVAPDRAEVQRRRARLPPPSLAPRPTRHRPHPRPGGGLLRSGPRAAGVTEIALTEHLFRFGQADRLLRGFWDDEPDAALRLSMESYWDDHARADLDAYVDCVLAAKDAGLPVVLGLEVDYYRGRMDDVAALLAGYPFDVLLGSVHWIGTWRFDDLDDPVSMDEWPARARGRRVVRLRDAVEELAASGTCDVLAHPDLVKVAGHRPDAPEECWDRLVEAAVSSGMAAELSSAGWRKPAAEAYPSPPLLERFVRRGVPLTTASDAHRLADVADRSAELAVQLSAARTWPPSGPSAARRPHDVPCRAGVPLPDDDAGRARRLVHRSRRGRLRPPAAPARILGGAVRPVVLGPPAARAGQGIRR